MQYKIPTSLHADVVYKSEHLLRYSPRSTKGVINCVDNVLFNSIVSSTRIVLNVNKERMLLRTSHRLCIGQQLPSSLVGTSQCISAYVQSLA